MSLVITSNNFNESGGADRFSEFNAPYSYNNEIRDGLRIEKNSEIAVQSVKVNKDGVITINATSKFYVYFGVPITALNVDQTTSFTKLCEFSFGSSNYKECTPEELALATQNAINNSICNPETSGENRVLVLRDPTSDEFKGFKWEFAVNGANPVDIKASVVSESWRNVYPSEDTAGLTYNKTARTLTALGTMGSDDRAYNVAEALEYPFSANGGQIEFDTEGLTSTGTTGRNSNWAIGLCRSDVMSLDSCPDYYDPNQSAFNYQHQFYDYVIASTQNILGGAGQKRYLRVFHAVKGNNNKITMKEIEYWNIASSGFTGGPYDMSANASLIDRVLYTLDNEQLRLDLVASAGPTTYECIAANGGTDQNQRFKPVSDITRWLYPKVFIQEPGNYCEILDWGTQGITEKWYIDDYGDPNLDWWAKLTLNNLANSIGNQFEMRNWNDDSITGGASYTAKGITTITNTQPNDYAYVMVLNPDPILYRPSDLATMSQIYGFKGSSVVDTYSDEAGTDNIVKEFESLHVPALVSNTSLFIRVNGLNLRSVNAGAGMRSQILYQLPRFDGAGNSVGVGLYYEPHERTYIKINNTDDIVLNQFSVDFVNADESLSTSLTGKSVVLFHIRPCK